MLNSRFGFFGLGLVLLPVALQAAATINIFVADPANVGFNDTTAAAPVGGNTGTTLGAQRLQAFQAAADKWGSTLTSNVPITISAQWTALTCNTNSAVLGSAGANQIFRDFSNAPVAGRWYSKALADKLAGRNLSSGNADIIANFNVNLGKTGCLEGVFFYLGLDNNHGGNIDLVAVLLHEFAHGLGFQTFTSGSTGSYLANVPSIWDDFLLDTTTSKVWSGMTDAERAASAVDTGHLVWNGSNVFSAVPSVLTQTNTPTFQVNSPASAAANYPVGIANFGPSLTVNGITGEVMPVVDSPNAGLACGPLSTLNAAAVGGKIALLDNGTCNVATKVKNAQNAGAIAVVIADNVAGSPPANLTGTDSTITIPSVMVTQAAGVILKSQLARRTRTHSNVFATLAGTCLSYFGTDCSSRMLMYSPNPYQSGSSVSHWDTSASRNQIMEPAINGDLPHEVTQPYDLTFKLLKDLGWN